MGTIPRLGQGFCVKLTETLRDGDLVWEWQNQESVEGKTMGHIEDKRLVPTNEHGFDARDVLAICTGVVADVHRLPDIYAVLGFMTGSPVRMSEFEAAMRECRSFLLHQHPEIARLKAPCFTSDNEAYQWLEEEALKLSGVIAVTRN
jgi:hypothetical protein